MSIINTDDRPEQNTSDDRQRVAVVTGANRGIGLQIVTSLAEQFHGVVYLTSRNQELGLQAVEQLNNQQQQQPGSRPQQDANERRRGSVKYHQLDVTDAQSIAAFVAHLRENHGGLDLLVNNAGVINWEKAREVIKQQFRTTLNTNFFGTVALTDALLPLMRPRARIIHLTSDWGSIVYLCNASLRQALLSPATDSVEKLSKAVRVCLEEAEGADYDTQLFEDYKTSKNALNALTRLHQELVDREHADKCIFVAAVHPGDVITGMNQNGFESVEEGSDTTLYLALRSSVDDLARGATWYKRHTYDWSDPKLDVNIFDVSPANMAIVAVPTRQL